MGCLGTQHHSTKGPTPGIRIRGTGALAKFAAGENMRARRWKREEGDSLDLLLDTMCNLFGGIVFVALLVALLAGDDAGKKVNPSRSPSQDLLEREIANLEEEEQSLKQILEEETKQSATKATTEDQAAVKTLKTELEALRQALALASEDKSKEQDLGQFLQEAKARKANLETENIRLENQKKSLLEEKERLAKRMADLKKRGEEAVEEKIQGFRFPRERASAKKPYWILLSGDEVFPVKNADSGWSYWEKYVSVRTFPNGEEIRPIAGRGLRSEKEIRAIFSSVSPASFYPVFIVQPDSFVRFRKAREIALEMGFEFGANFDEMGNPLKLVTEGGTRPGVQ
jgi:hypothetical protein